MSLQSPQSSLALHAFAGLLHYFRPQSMASLYVGADYWAQIAQRDSLDAGTVIGVAGVQGALSSRGSLFLEGGDGGHCRRTPTIFVSRGSSARSVRD